MGEISDATAVTLDEVLANCAPAPFSHDPLAQKINRACDYSIRLTAEMARSGSAPRRPRVYADGVYDMFHSGHARQLMQAKRAFPNAYLIIGVCNDADVHRLKGRTVMNESERYEAIRHCRYVDEVVTDAPWSINQEYLLKHKIDFVAHDDIPYASAGTEDVYQPFKDAGMFVVTNRTEGISTTDVIGRIVRDYDLFLRRNIRRGLSRKELNISYMKEKKLKLQDNFETIMKRGSKFIENFDNKRKKIVDHLEDMSHEFVRSFMRIFGSDGRLLNWINNRKPALKYSQEEGSSSSLSSTSPMASTSEHSEDHESVNLLDSMCDASDVDTGLGSPVSDSADELVYFYSTKAPSNKLNNRKRSLSSQTRHYWNDSDGCRMAKNKRSSISESQTGRVVPPGRRTPLTAYRLSKAKRSRN